MEMKIFKIFGQGWKWGRGQGRKWGRRWGWRQGRGQRRGGGQGRGRGRGQGRGQGRARVWGRVRDGDSDKQTTTNGRTDRFIKANIVSDVAYNTLRQK